MDEMPAVGAGLPWAYQILSNSKFRSFYHFKSWLAKVKAVLIVLILFALTFTSVLKSLSLLSPSPFYWFKIPLESPFPLVTLSNLLPLYPQ